ncbi:MAG: thiamine phosphate synthase [Pseudomonadota bacterium]
MSAAAALPRFYQIVETAAQLARFAPLGLKLAQLRIKDRPEPEIRAEIAAALETARAAGVILVINDHWRAAIDLGADFVHLGQEDLDAADLGAIRAAGLRLGVSTHDHAELDRALALSPDYVALGPIYPTILKAMRFGPQGLERITEWRARAQGVPLVAIGGLTVARAPAVYAAGADSICVVTDVLRAAAPEARLAEWLTLAGDG